LQSHKNYEETYRREEHETGRRWKGKIQNGSNIYRETEGGKAGRGKDVRTKINEKMKEQGSKRRENILRQSEGRRVKDKNSFCYTLKKNRSECVRKS